MIEIVSDDRAFDAVGDVASSLGVTFRRLSYRGLLGMPAADVPSSAAAHEGDGHGDARGRRRRRRGGRGRDHGRQDHGQHRAPMHQAPPPPRPAAEPVAAEDGPHSAPHDELVAVVRDLVQAAPGRNVTLDTLANALKSRGFSRPPGSPRLITRLRRIKELEVSRAGVITLVGAAARPTPAEPVSEAAPVDAVEPAPEEARPERPEPVSVDAESGEMDEDPPQPADNRSPGPGGGDGGRRRRRSRRGGRRRGRDREGGGGPQFHGGREAPPAREPTPPRTTGADRARDVASRYAPRDVAPSWISGQPLA
jgi:hypothetical protein